MSIFIGRVWKLGDNISTDLLMPTKSMFGKVATEEMKHYCLQPVRPEFSKEVKPGDIIVAGENFGCGSSRPAAKNLIGLGLSCVIAESCSAIFYRNSVSMGFPIIISKGVTEIFQDGEMAKIVAAQGKIYNESSQTVTTCDTFPPFLQKIIEVGGIVEIFRQGIRLGDL